MEFERDQLSAVAFIRLETCGVARSSRCKYFPNRVLCAPVHASRAKFTQLNAGNQPLEPQNRGNKTYRLRLTKSRSQTETIYG